MTWTVEQEFLAGIQFFNHLLIFFTIKNTFCFHNNVPIHLNNCVPPENILSLIIMYIHIHTYYIDEIHNR